MTELEVAILEKGIALVLQLLGVFLLPLATYWAARLLARVQEANNWEQVRLLVRTAVRTAEQLELTGALDQYGDDKLTAAFMMINEDLAARGIPIDLNQYRPQIRKLIEEAVRDLNLDEEFGLLEGP